MSPEPFYPIHGPMPAMKPNPDNDPLDAELDRLLARRDLPVSARFTERTLERVRQAGQTAPDTASERHALRFPVWFWPTVTAAAAAVALALILQPAAEDPSAVPPGADPAPILASADDELPADAALLMADVDPLLELEATLGPLDGLLQDDDQWETLVYLTQGGV
ncbi:MAG: hypothetical protein ACFE0O_06990 [Opitutales bacterium]